MEQLKRLGEGRDAGVLTPAEFSTPNQLKIKSIRNRKYLPPVGLRRKCHFKPTTSCAPPPT